MHLCLCVCVVCSDFNGGCGRANNVEVLFPESNMVGSESQSASVPQVASNVGSTGPASALSAAADCKTLAEKAIAALPPSLVHKQMTPRERQGHRTQDGSLGGGQTQQRRILFSVSSVRRLCHLESRGLSSI